MFESLFLRKAEAKVLQIKKVITWIGPSFCLPPPKDFFVAILLLKLHSRKFFNKSYFFSPLDSMSSIFQLRSEEDPIRFSDIAVNENTRNENINVRPRWWTTNHIFNFLKSQINSPSLFSKTFKKFEKRNLHIFAFKSAWTTQLYLNNNKIESGHISEK